MDKLNPRWVFYIIGLLTFVSCLTFLGVEVASKKAKASSAYADLDKPSSGSGGVAGAAVVQDQAGETALRVC